MKTNYVFGGRDILVGIATSYRMHSLGNDSWWVAIFSPSVQGVPEIHPISCKMGNVVIAGLKLPGLGINKQLTIRFVVKESVHELATRYKLSHSNANTAKRIRKNI